MVFEYVLCTSTIKVHIGHMLTAQNITFEIYIQRYQFMNPVKLDKILNVITLFRLILYQTEFLFMSN